jgi:DNA-binding SARP family transcriptional activator
VNGEIVAASTAAVLFLVNEHRVDQIGREIVLISLLGTVSVTVDGSLCDIRASKVRAMLATLALDPGRPVSYGDLAAELWSGRALGNARNALQAHAARLRKLLDEPALRAVPNGYVLDVSPGDVDATRFLDLAARGSALVATDPRAAIDLLEAGLLLWRGPALLDAGDGLRCRAAAALFEERRLTLWEDLTTARLAIGDDAAAVADLGSLVTANPLREAFCDQLMLALYRCGRQGEALAVFHRTRVHLDDELGLQPSARLRRRYADILAQDPALTGRFAEAR